MVPTWVAFGRTAGEDFLFSRGGGLTHSKQSIVKQATITIEPILKKSVMEERLNKPKPNWRTHDINFLDDSSRDTLEPGAVNFSAGWLGQGHTVSFIFYIITKSNLKRIK